MILKEFDINGLNLIYFVGLGQINFDFSRFLKINDLKKDKEGLDKLFNMIEDLQEKREDLCIQFINQNYIINQDHIYTACYFVRKAFYDKLNISNRKNLELLLYLAGVRQIKNAIESFGITIDQLKGGSLTYCVIANTSKEVESLNLKLLEKFEARDTPLTLNALSIENFLKIKQYYEFTDEQVKIVLKAHDLFENYKSLNSVNVKSLFFALNELVCEKMALLSTEKA